jgi:hypothetical protein
MMFWVLDPMDIQEDDFGFWHHAPHLPSNFDSVQAREADV